jgi:outer membrane protein assembly factor BamE (lipoprotein component of BamABCDE complex)
MSLSLSSVFGAGSVLAALSIGCAASPGISHFDTTHADEIRKGATREQVMGLVGPPQTVIHLMPNALHANELWTYTNFVRGWLAFNVETLSIRFDASGNAVAVLHDKTNN